LKGPFFIGVAGNIGVGKTTFTQMISEHFDWDPHYEVVVDNPYLEDFYSDMMRWSFHLQIFFLSKRFQVQKTITRLQRTTIQDRTIYEDANIFAKSIFELGNMTERDWDNYRELFGEMTSYLKSPDLIIYLQAGTDSLISRIKKRGRDYEQSMDLEYLHLLNMRYDQWIGELQKSGDIPVLLIPTDGHDFVEEQDFRKDIFRRVEQRLTDLYG